MGVGLILILLQKCPGMTFAITLVQFCLIMVFITFLLIIKPFSARNDNLK